MKTLNEVIEELNIWDAYDHEYPDVFYDTQTTRDALHYLREYRDKHDEMLKTEEALGYCEMAENRPLTWDELKTMEGKPVWVERPQWKEWLLISEIDEDKCEIYLRDKWGNGVIVNGRNIGYWRAYRKERS